jgi:hypothetical protein
MIQDFSQTEIEPRSSPGLYAMVDGLLAFLAVGLVAFGLDAVFRAMN